METNVEVLVINNAVKENVGNSIFHWIGVCILIVTLISNLVMVFKVIESAR